MSPILEGPGGLLRFWVDPPEFKFLQRVDDQMARGELIARLKDDRGIPAVVEHRDFDPFVLIDGARYWRLAASAEAAGEPQFVPAACPEYHLAQWMIENDLADVQYGM